MKFRNIMIGLAAAFLLLASTPIQAADWSPRGSIKLQVGFGAGGSTDIMGRLVAAELEKQTGWNMIVENKPGGGGVAMFSSLMHQKPDGLTLGLGVNVPILLNLVMRPDSMPFDVDSFDYIGTITRGENAMVARPDAPFDDFEGFIAYAKKQGGVAVGFDAKPQQMILNAVSGETGAKFKYVSHKSGAEQIQSILGGHVLVGCLAGAHIKYIESGDLKMIAAFNKKRHSYSPETKTIIESGYPYYLDPYYYIAAPKGLPADVKAALVKAFDDAIHSDNVTKAIYNTLKAPPVNIGPEGVQEMLTDGVKDIKVLVDANK